MLLIFKRMLVLTTALPLVACTSFWQMWSSDGTRDGVSSSLVDYLYPKGEQPPTPGQDIPKLNLPLRVGIAFVPPQYGAGGAISEATKLELLNNVKAAFMDREYIAHIEVIPETYLRSSNGFDGLSQVARLYGVDIMALVSYDQVAVSEDTNASFFYWTIVGAYLIQGTKNEVQTFVDTAVFDVPTRKLLFRAPGTDVQGFRSTAAESSEAVRSGRTASFAAAMTAMTDNLAIELAAFEERLKTEPQLAEVKWYDNVLAGGGGSMDPSLLLALMVLLRSTGCLRRPLPRAV